MNVFDLAARIGLDKSEYESGLEDAKGKAASFASSVGNGLKTVAKVGAAAVAAGAAGVAALTKMGVEGYAQYEQLTGGVETLFKESGNAVMKYAENAYKTSGLSANAYMETVTSFSASLIGSLDGDTAKAANVADMAITDMADNANKMGTSIELIQNAYNGFAKGNFTMLDNLKLGYGGTGEEMKRLLKDAEKLSGVKYDISSFADISEAIHVVQENMGIAGATAAEAATTIEGSLGMMKGAWENLVVGMADENADMGTLIDNFVESVLTVGDNIMPRIEQTLAGIGQLVEGLAPIIADKLPAIVTSLLPSLLNAAVGLVTSVANALPGLLNSLLPVALTAVLDVFMALVEAITGNMDTIFEAITNGLFIILESLPSLLPQLISAVVSVIVMLCQNLITLIQPIIDNLPVIVMAVSEALLDNLPILLGGILALIVGIAQAIPSLLGAIWEALKGALGSIASHLGEWLSPVWDSITGWFADLWAGISNGINAALDWVVNLLTPVGQWIYDNIIAPVAQFFVELWEGIVNAYHTVIDPWIEIFTRIAAIVDEKIIQPVKEFFVGLWNDIVAVFSVAADWFTTNISEPIKNIFTGIWEKLKNGASDAWEGIKSVFSTISDWFGNVFSKAWQKVKDVFSTGGKVFDGIKDGIVSVFKTVVNAIIGGINKVIAVPLNAINSILQKIRDIEIVGIKPFSWIWTFTVPQIPKLSTGLNYVPYDEYPALLHRGEAVLTAAEARAWRNGQMTPAMAGGITINQYIQSVPQTPVEMAAATEAYFEQARWTL